MKTGYLLAKELKDKHGIRRGLGGDSSRNEQTSGAWKFLWSLNMKHKLKHFIWKCLHGILPVNEVVKSRTGKGDDKCACYGEYIKTMEHMFFFCQHAALA